MTPDKENRETSQEAEAGTIFAFGLQGLSDAFVEAHRKERESTERRIRRLEKALGLPADGFTQADIDALAAENTRLRAIEVSVLQMAYHLRNGFWWPSTETGAAQEIHSAITRLHTDMEEIAAERDKLKEEVDALRKAKGELVVKIAVDDIRSGGRIWHALAQKFGIKGVGQ